MKVCCLPSIPSPENFKIRLFLDANDCELVRNGRADRRIWCDNIPRKDIRRQDQDINGRMTDASKSWLEANVRKAFGYGYRVDHKTYHGPMVNKYRWHARYPVVVNGPLPSMVHVNPAYTFFSELLTGIEWRIAFFGFSVVCTYTKRQIGADGLGSEKRIDGSSIYNVPWQDVMAKSERIKLKELANLIGLDYGEFDVIRHSDGRFCPIDVNPSPSPPSPHSFMPEDFSRIIPTEAELFWNEVL